MRKYRFEKRLKIKWELEIPNRLLESEEKSTSSTF